MREIRAQAPVSVSPDELFDFLAEQENRCSSPAASSRS